MFTCSSRYRVSKARNAIGFNVKWYRGSLKLRLDSKVLSFYLAAVGYVQRITNIGETHAVVDETSSMLPYTVGGLYQCGRLTVGRGKGCSSGWKSIRNLCTVLPPAGRAANYCTMFNFAFTDTDVRIAHSLLFADNSVPNFRTCSIYHSVLFE